MADDNRGLACPICLGTQANQFHDRVWGIEGGTVYRCAGCGVVFIQPMMNELEEREFYQQYNRHVQSRGVTLSSDPAELHGRSQPVAKERLQVVRNYFPEGIKVLEIGAATGSFLELLPHNECASVEPATDNRIFSAQFAKNIYADISDIGAEEQFDVICMFHVFEHIRNPQHFLQTCTKHLVDGGKIIIEVPHIDDPLISIYNLKEFKDFYFQPMHPFVHSLKSLRYIFGSAGLNEEEVIYYQRYGLDNHLAWLTLKKSVGSPDLQKLFSANDAYKQALTVEKKTDTLYYVVSYQADREMQGNAVDLRAPHPSPPPERHGGRGLAEG